MRQTIIYNIVLLSFALLVSLDVQAQQDKRVEITTIYIPEVSPAVKIGAPTVINDTPEYAPDVEYSINPETWQITLDAHNFKPATATYWDFDRSKHFYFKAATGYPFNTVGTFRYSMQNRGVGYFGVGVEHLGDLAPRVGSNGVERSMKQSFSLNNRLNIGGGAYLGGRLLKARATYDYDVYNPYAVVGDVARRSYNNIDAAIRFGDEFSDLSRINFSVEVHGGYWLHSSPTMSDVIISKGEYRLGGSARLARDFDRNRVALTAGYDLWSLGDTGMYSDNRFNIGAEYRRKFGIVDIDAGLTYMYDKVERRDKPSHFVMPRVRVLVDLQKAEFAPYAELTTTVSQNGYQSLYAHNPFIDDSSDTNLYSMANTRSYNLVVGFTGTALSSRLAYRAYVGAKFMRDKLFWYVTRPGMFGVTTDDNTRLFFGVEAQYKPVGGLVIAASFYTNYDWTHSQYKSSDEKFSADLNIEYSFKQWRFYAKADVLGRREWSCPASDAAQPMGVFVMPTQVDLGVGVSCRLSQTVELYVDGHNLLNSRIYDWAYYYRPGAGFTAGVKLNF